LAGRLVARFGRTLRVPHGRVTHVFPPAGDLRNADVGQMGVPMVRAEAVRRFATAVATGEISFDGATEPAIFCAGLTQLPGIGSWTAEYIALRALADPDAFPSADLGLLRATGTKTAAQLARRAESWRPWRAYAAMHLWMSM